MDIYQHDSAAMFRFVLRGELTGNVAPDLEHAWKTTQSILRGKELLVDIAGITRADPAGIELLTRMRDSGARLTAALPPASGDLLHSLGIPAAAPRERRSGTWVARAARTLRLRPSPPSPDRV